MLLVRLILQLVLFVVFLLMYGLPALDRLNKKSTIVIKTRWNTEGIQAPSLTISARSRTNGMGWKEKHISNAHDNDTIVHQCKGFATVEQCLDSQTFDSTFIRGTLLGYETKLSLTEEGDVWKPDFTYVRYGRSYTFHPERKIGPEDDKDQLIILLDNNYCYDIFVHEKKFFILNDNRCALPSNYFKLIPDASNHSKVVYKISVTQHIELNVPEDPCVEDDQYDFGVCVKESLARQVGCRPSWDVWSEPSKTEIDAHRWVSRF